MATKVYRCSLCSCAGHNKTNCPTVPLDQRLAAHIATVKKRNATLATKRKASSTELDSQMPTPSAPVLPSSELEASTWFYIPCDDIQSPSDKIALLEESLSLAQTRAREAEERVEHLTIERDEARQLAQTLDAELSKFEERAEHVEAELVSRYTEQIRVLQASLDNLMVKNEELKTAIAAKDEQLVHVQNNTRSNLAKLTQKVQQYQGLLDIAQIELAETKKNKLSDDEELAGLLHRHNIFNEYTELRVSQANHGWSEAEPRANELNVWCIFLQKLKSQDQEAFDKEKNAEWIHKLLNGGFSLNRSQGCNIHGYYGDIYIELARWLKQKGYLPVDFDAGLTNCTSKCNFHGWISRGLPHPTL